MAKHQVENIRNMVLVGHGATGKTTLADLLLFKAGVGSRAGSVDDGTSVLDTEDDEQDRKSSITSALIHFEHGGKRFNVIDTPGYPDFIGQVLGALAVVETAVIVINAGSGIEVNTRRVFAKSGDAGIGRAIVINKCDGENINCEQLLSDIQESFGTACVPLNLPVGLGADFNGVVSTLQVPSDIPAGTVGDPKAVNQTAMDAIVEADEELMMRFLEGEALAPDEIAAGVSKAIAAGTLIPIFFTSSKTGAGVPELMAALAQFALSPLDIKRSGTNAGGNEVAVEANTKAGLVAQVFKSRIDPFVAKMSYIRIFSGELKKDANVHMSGTDKTVRIAQLLEMQGAHHESVDSASVGDLVAVVKMDDLKVGDTLSKDVGFAMPAISFPTPMIGLAVEPKSRADQSKISGALAKFEDEDQTFQIYRDPQTKEMVIRGMSELHLQIIQERLLKREKVDVNTHLPKIPYRETVAGTSEGHYRHKKQSGGSGQFGEVHFKVSPMPIDVDPDEYFVKDRFESMRNFKYHPEFNYAFVDRISQGSIPNNFIPAIEKGVIERMSQGVLADFQVEGVIVELYFGKDHPVDSNETAFKTAASHCFKQEFLKAKPALLEPIVNIEISVPDDKLGDITSDLNGRRGRVEGMEGVPGGFQIIRAKVPLSEVMTYARSLSSMTGGQGSFSLEFSHYELVPPNEQAKIVAAAQKAKEEES
ncbi:MAG: elongation factor G [Planctomycetota bacterium]|nr:elongation factor G [Planctomycetota bacterium]